MNPLRPEVSAPTFEVVSILDDFARDYAIPIPTTLDQLERTYPDERNLFYDALGDGITDMVRLRPDLHKISLVLRRQHQTAEAFMRIAFEIRHIDEVA